MSLLTLIWPVRRSSWELVDGACACFTISDGQFSVCSRDSEKKADTVIFYEANGRLEIVSYLRHQPCYVNGTALQYGGQCIAEPGSAVQAGHFGIAIDDQQHDESLIEILGFSEASGRADAIPELDGILRNSQLHALSRPEAEQGDILKVLEREYRQALLRGIQPPADNLPRTVAEPRFTEHMFDFDHIQEQVKLVTVTECILAQPALIQRVFDELNIADGEEIGKFVETTSQDVLQLLHPAQRGYDMKKRIPELLLKEMYRADLDTQF